MDTITITVEGGVIQDISGVPKGARVVVMDYDIEGYTNSELQTDSNGDEYRESVFEHGD